MKSLVVFGVSALALGAVCLISMLHATGGQLSMPLDDAFIFFQYAKRVTQGAFLSYQAGDPATAGATSLLTVMVHAVAYLLGFRGSAMVVFALILGAGCLVWAAHSAFILGRRWCPGVAWAPPALLLVSGPLIWGMYSGMDLPLFVALSLAMLASVSPEGNPLRRRTFLYGALLGLARPDGLFLVAGAALLLWRRGRVWGWGIALGGALFPFVLQWLITGSPQSASMDVKSILSRPDLSTTEWLVQGVSHLTYVVKGIFFGAELGDAAKVAANDRSAAGMYWFPLALGFLVLGLLPGAWLEIRARRFNGFTILLVWVVLMLASQAFTVPTHWHWNRYLIPVYALAIPAVAVGLDRAGRLVERVWPELSPQDGGRLLALFAVVLSLPGLVFFLVVYGRNCADIRFQHIELAQNLNASSEIQANSVVAVHDVGALAYYGDYKVLDIEGLADERFRTAGRLRGAGIFEAIEAMPPTERPDLLAVYPTWFDSEFVGLHRRITAQRQFAPSIAAGNPLTVYVADWSLAGSGDKPANVPPSCRLLAKVDVADLVSEAAADYHYWILDGAYDSPFRALASGATPVADGGRLISGGETFVVKGGVPGEELVLATRSHAPFRVRVLVGDDELGVWSSPPAQSGSWVEGTFTFRVPSGVDDRMTLTLASDDPHHSAYGSFHYWVYRCSE